MLTRLKKLRNFSNCDIEDVIKIVYNKRSKNAVRMCSINKNKKINSLISNGVAKKLYMVQPTHFYTNQETKCDNAFMQDIINEKGQEEALEEFNNFVKELKVNNVEVEIFKQMHADAPDSIFLNNWFSTHSNEFFPAYSRRLEKHPGLIESLKKNYKHFVDLSYLEEDNEYLESTGSLIFDHNNRKIYCCLSERATIKALNVLMETINKFAKEPFKLITFKGTDNNDKTIYHTNCMLAILQVHSVICLSAIKDLNEREIVKTNLEENRIIIEISLIEMEHFCGNVINVKNKEDKTIVLMSENAKNNFSKKNLKILTKAYSIIAPNLCYIEKIGGGSARCMVAEGF